MRCLGAVCLAVLLLGCGSVRTNHEALRKRVCVEAYLLGTMRKQDDGKHRVTLENADRLRIKLSVWNNWDEPLYLYTGHLESSASMPAGLRIVLEKKDGDEWKELVPPPHSVHSHSLDFSGAEDHDFFRRIPRGTPGYSFIVPVFAHSWDRIPFVGPKDRVGAAGGDWWSVGGIWDYPIEKGSYRVSAKHRVSAGIDTKIDYYRDELRWEPIEFEVVEQAGEDSR